jgi:hypothetical protein
MRTYIQLSRAWYADANLRNAPYVDNIAFMEDEPQIECQIYWYDLGALCPRLEVFDDQWQAFTVFADVFTDMATDLANQNVSPSYFCEFLKAHGFEDVTPAER